MRGLDKYNHNDGSYHQEGVFVQESIFLHFHRSIIYSHRNLVVRQVSACITKESHQSQIPPTKEKTSLAHKFYIRSDEYGCKISPGPWPTFSYNLPNILLLMRTGTTSSMVVTMQSVGKMKLHRPCIPCKGEDSHDESPDDEQKEDDRCYVASVNTFNSIPPPWSDQWPLLRLLTKS